jgi:septal ring factor EnvC (AmiA/AmiB activator)
MSSENVLVPAALRIAVVALAAPAAVLWGVGKIVQEIVNDRVEAAKKKIEAENTRIREWQSFQEKQAQEMNKLKKIQQSIEESEKQLRAIRLTAGNTRRTGTGPTAQGYTSLNQTRETDSLIRSQLENIAKILRSLPEEFTNSPSSPHLKLVKYEDTLKSKLDSGTPPAIEEINTFKEMILRTLTSFSEELEMKRKADAHIKQKVGIVFDEIPVTQELAIEKEHLEELNTIKSKLLQLANSNNPRLDRFELLEKQYETVKAEINLLVTKTAISETAADSLTKNLMDMGYEPREYFTRMDDRRMLTSLMRIPGGDYVRIKIDRNNQISFQVTHAMMPGETTMQEDGLLFFRQQEKRWCRDFQELVRRLTREGFS